MGCNKTNPRLLLIVCLSVVLSFSKSTLAQDSTSGGMHGAIEEIVVTAQKREQNANDIGMSITTLTAEVMEQYHFLHTTELASVIPGLTYSDTGFSIPVYTLRGVGFSENTPQGTSTVGVYNDQVPLMFPIMTQGLHMDMERVEVLKGPQGTLFGGNTTGGAINYIANKPGDEFEASATVGYGNFETVDIEGVVSGPLNDKVSARLAVRTLHSGEGWQKSLTRDETLGEKDKSAARLLVNIDASDSLNILLAASWWEDQSETQAPQVWALDPSRFDEIIVGGYYNHPVYGRFPILGTDDSQAADWPTGRTIIGGNSKPGMDMSNKTLSATLNWDFDSVSLTSITAYTKFDNDTVNSNSGWQGIPLDLSVMGVTPRDTIPEIVRDEYNDLDRLTGNEFLHKAEIETWSQELRLSGQRDALNWVVGAYYATNEISFSQVDAPDLSVNTNRFYAFTPVIGTQKVNNIYDQDSDTWAVFGHTEWDLQEDWKLTVGLRYTDDRIDYEGCMADSGGGDIAQFFALLLGAKNTGPGLCASLLSGTFTSGLNEDELDEDSLSGKLALDWSINDDVLVYGAYSRGYKSGSFPTVAAASADQLAGVTQEKVNSYELGIKATIWDGTAQLNAATYFYDYTDKQLLSKVTIPIFGPAATLVNVPEAEVMGAEFDLQWVPVDGLIIGLSGSYTDSEVTEFVGFTQQGVEGDMSGSPFPYTPELQLTGLFTYEWRVGSNVAFVGVDISYTDAFQSDYDVKTVFNPGYGPAYDRVLDRTGVVAGDSFPAGEIFQHDSYTLIGARVGIRADDDRWQATLWSRNLTDEYYSSNSRRSNDLIIAYTGMPRTYGLTLSYSLN